MLAFDPATHTYRLRGEKLPSVTDVLPSPLGLHRASLYDIEYKRALGTAVHMAIRLDIDGQLEETTVDVEVWPYLRAWRDFVRDTGFAPVMTHCRLHSERYGYAGELDVVGVLSGRIVLPDFKTTTAKPGPVTALQTAGYAQLVKEARGLDPKRRFALWLRPDTAPGYNLVPFDDPADWPNFLSFLNTHKWRLAHGYATGEAE